MITGYKYAILVEAANPSTPRCCLAVWTEISWRNGFRESCVASCGGHACKGFLCRGSRRHGHQPMLPSRTFRCHAPAEATAPVVICFSMVTVTREQSESMEVRRCSRPPRPQSGRRLTAGYCGIEEPGCSRSGYCWSLYRERPGDPFCYLPNTLQAPDPRCQITNPNDRTPCSKNAISLMQAERFLARLGACTQSECENSGCCWGPLPLTARGPWCYQRLPE